MSHSTSIFDRSVDIKANRASSLLPDGTDEPNIRVYVAGERAQHAADICLYFIHGAGSSSMTWHFQVQHLKDIAMIIAPDLRGHASSFVPSTMHMNDLVDDTELVLLAFKEQIGSRRVILIGHSLGGSIAVRLASRRASTGDISAVVVLDVAEDTALHSLSIIDKIVCSWPRSFTSQEEYAQWSTTISRPQSSFSSRISTIDHLIRGDDHLLYTKFDLLKWRDDWSSWFIGFNDTFLSLRCYKFLILSHRDNLDTTLLTAIMQGKLECHSMSNPFRSHFFQEDSPEEFIHVLSGFLRNKGFITDEHIKLLHTKIRPPVSVSAESQFSRKFYPGDHFYSHP